jgi:hypothetical protein
MDDDSPSGQPGKLDQMAEQARRTASTVKQRATDAAGHVTAAASDLGAHVKESALSAAEQGKEGIASELDDVADAVHRSGEQLEGHQDWLATLVERGADELGELADTVRSNDLRGLMAKLEDLARSQPVLFFGAAMAAGFASARLGRVAVAGASRADLPKMPEAQHD